MALLKYSRESSSRPLKTLELLICLLLWIIYTYLPIVKISRLFLVNNNLLVLSCFLM